MKIQNILVGLLILVFIGGGAYFAYRRVVLPNERCDICGRSVSPDHASTVLLKNGKKLRMCCPRCALHHEQHSPSLVAGLLVTDFTTGRQVTAQECVYVEGSDERLCIPESAEQPREPGIEYDLAYDRCLPSLVAFKEESVAREFVVRHGGRVLSYEQVLESVKNR